MEKKCTKCGSLKKLDEFYADPRMSDKRMSACKECTKSKVKEYYEGNKEKVAENEKERRLKNPDKIKQQRREEYQRNKDNYRVAQKRWRENNKEKYDAINRAYVNERMRTDVEFKIKRYLRTRLYKAVKGILKAGSAVKDCGCSVEELKLFISSKFSEGMTWDNWGAKPGCWQIHHIEPLAHFDLTNREQLLKACHYTNLQPMWYEEHQELHGLN